MRRLICILFFLMLETAGYAQTDDRCLTDAERIDLLQTIYTSKENSIKQIYFVSGTRTDKRKGIELSFLMDNFSGQKCDSIRLTCSGHKNFTLNDISSSSVPNIAAQLFTLSVCYPVDPKQTKKLAGTEITGIYIYTRGKVYRAYLPAEGAARLKDALCSCK